MAGIKVGEGYVEVRVKSDLDDDVQEAATKAEPAAKKGGDSLGKTISSGIAGAFAGFQLGEMITGSLDQSKVQANLQARLTGTSKVVAAQAGKAAGEVFAQGYGESMEDVNDAIVGIQDNLGGLAKYSQKQTQDMSKDALTIANVYGQDVNEVIRTAGGLMKNGLAKNADDAFDIISSGMKNGLNNSDELLDSLNEYAEPLSAIGLDGPAALGAFKRSLDAGNFSIDKAGDAINEFATRSIDGSKTTLAAYDALGLNGEDMMKRISAGGKSARDATHEVISRLGDMKDSVSQDATGVALFGSMWEDAGKKTILALDPAKGSIDGVKGSTDEMAKANESAGNKVEAMQRQVEQWKNSLIQTSGPVGNVTAILGTMGPEGIAAGAGVITASKGLGEMAVASGKGAKAMALATGASVKNTAAQVKNGAAWLASKGKVVASTIALGASKVPMLASAAATGVATAAQWAFNSAMLANPITWIIVGIVALIAAIVLLIANWDTVVKFITDTWSSFMAWIQPALDAVGQWWSGLWKGISDLAMSIFAAVTSWIIGKIVALKTGMAAIGSAISAWWSGLWSGVGNFVRSVLNSAVSWVIGKFNQFTGGLKSIGNGISSWWSGLWNGIGNLLRGVVSGISNTINGLVKWLGGLPGRIGSAVSGMWNGITSGFKGALNGVIRAWNGFSLSVPGIEVFGHKIGGFTLNTPDLPYFEKGTNHFAGGPAIVGENGPELVNLPAGSSVTPNGPTERAMASGNVTYVTNNNVTINEAEDPLGSAGRVGVELRKWSKK